MSSGQVFIRGHNAANESQRSYLIALFDYDNPKLRKVGITFATGDIQLILPGDETPDNIPTTQINELGSTGIYELILTQSEQNHGGGKISIKDQTNPPVWIDADFNCEWWGESPNAATVPIDILGDGAGSLLQVNATLIGSSDVSAWAKVIDQILHVKVTNAVVTATSTLARIEVLAGATPAIDAALVRRPIVFISTIGGGALSGVTSRILSFDESDLEITYTALPQAPADDDEAIILL